MRIFIVFLLCFTSVSGFAQQLLLSPDESVPGTSGNVRVVGTVGQKTVCFLESSNAYELLWYDSAMRKLAVSTLDFLERGAERFRFYPTQDAVYIFYQRKKRKQVNLWAARIAPIDKDTVAPVLIDSLALRGGWDDARFELYGTNRDDRFVYALSEHDKKNSRLALKIKVLNDQLQMVQQANEQMNDVVYHDLLDIILDPNDGLHVLYGEPARRGQMLQNILLGSQAQNVRSMQFSKLDLEAYNIGDGRFVQHPTNGKLYLGGLLYKNDVDRVDAIGAFIYDANLQKWLASNITDIYNQQVVRQGRLSKMRLKDMLLKEDGGYSIMLEKSYQETYQRNRSIGFVSPGIGMASSSYEVYHNDEIVVFDISETGDLQWSETVLKQQETTDANERYQSFAKLSTGLGRVLLFVDQTNNSNRFINAFLSNTGRMQLKQFTAAGADELQESGMMLRSAQQTGTNEIVFPMVKRGTLSFAKIIF